MNPEQIKSLSDDEIRVKVALLVGWAFLDGEWPFLTGLPKHWQGDHSRLPIPNYPRDLNAMHRAEKIIPINLRSSFVENLYRRFSDACVEVSYEGGHDFEGMFDLMNATARQRAEALLMTMEP